MLHIQTIPCISDHVRQFVRESMAKSDYVTDQIQQLAVPGSRISTFTEMRDRLQAAALADDSAEPKEQ